MSGQTARSSRGSAEDMAGVAPAGNGVGEGWRRQGQRIGRGEARVRVSVGELD